MTSPQNSSAVPCFVLGFTDSEMALVSDTLKNAGYDDDLKSWILDNMQKPDDEKYTGSADRVINNLADFIRTNPDSVRAGVSILGKIVQKATKKGTP